MKIVVAGCGKVGRTITEQLSLEGHEIAIIDKNDAVVKDVTNEFDVMGVVGNVASREVQKEAGIDDADLLIAVSDSDEVNVLSCLMAKKAGCTTIARIRNPIYSREIGYIKEELGLSMSINPEQAAASEISRLLRVPSAIAIETFSRGLIELLEVKVPAGSIICNMRVQDVCKATGSDVLVAAIERDGEAIIPSANFVIEEGDSIAIVAAPMESRNFFKEIGIEQQRIKNVMVVGGGNIGFYLTRQLLATGFKVKIIDKDRERCEQLAEMLPDADIILGDANDEDLLVEEGIEHIDAFVSMTGIDEANIFYSMFAKEKAPNAKLVTKVNKMSFSEIIKSFDLGSIVYPKFMTAERIVRYVRARQNGIGSNVETMHRIIGNKAEALEFIANNDEKITSIPLRDMNMKDNTLIACIIKGKDIVYPHGDTTIENGDRVIVVTRQKGLNDLKDILK